MFLRDFAILILTVQLRSVSVHLEVKVSGEG